MEFLLENTSLEVEEVKFDDSLLEGDIIIEQNGKKIEQVEETKETIEEKWTLDISESVGWIKESLKKFNNPKFKNPKYKGPTMISNFVTDNLFMGGYPNNKYEIYKLIGIGINTFVCLNGSDKKTYYKYEDELPKNINYIHEPIEDMNITTDEKIVSLCQEIAYRIKEKGEKVFVHCKGGHGRTGTVVACVLYLLYKLSFEEILDYLQFVHDQREGCWFGYYYYTYHLSENNPFKNNYALGQVPVPQVEIQIDQIKRIQSTFSILLEKV